MIFHFDRFHGSGAVSIENLGNSAGEQLLENWWNVSQSTFLHEIVTAARDDFAVRIIIIFIVFDTSKLTTRAEHSSRWAKIRAKCAFKTVIFPSLPRGLTFLFFDTEDVPGNDRTSLIS